MFNSRDIIIVPFPFTDLTSEKQRPALIISNDIVNLTNDVIVAQITSNLHNDDFSFLLNRNMLSEPLKF